MIDLFNIAAGSSFFLIAGPCAIEDRDTCNGIAHHILKVSSELGIPFIFKGSYRKANRSRLESFQGIGDQVALQILGDIRTSLDIPVTTDIHLPTEAETAAQVVDVIQIPAFLSRQTDLLIAASATEKIVNIKKGQFMSADNMKHAVHKVQNSARNNVWLTERGTTFGYQDLVVDYRNIPWMKETGMPVILDCTHSLQQPNQASGVTGGRPALIDTIASAGIAAGADGLFIETHPNPETAKSDGANMLPLHQLKPLLEKLVRIKSALTD